MRTDSRQIVDRLWKYCSVLRDDGLSYPDYVEQLTYLLFLKMAQEQAEASPDRAPIVPEEYGWQSLVHREGKELHSHYSAALAALGHQPGMLGTIFFRAESKIRDPAKLRLLIVDLIDKRNWSALDVDVKGDAYEGLLEKNAQDTKSGAGQYFTPRPVVRAIVECVRPQLGETIHDPACGTAGFLLAAHEFLRRTNPELSEKQAHHLRTSAISGVELVDAVTRLATMNLLLHGIGATSADEGEPPIRTADSLALRGQRLYDVILTNPPFGKSSSVTVVNERTDRARQPLSILREDFRVSTANKQLNFLQHVASVLAPGGRAAIVVPDSVLSGGGAAEAIRRRLLDEFDVHTLLRLPTGLFYAQGVRASVMFFDRPKVPPRTPVSRAVWIYDLRAGMRFSPSSRPLTRPDLNEFVERYNPEARHRRSPTWSELNPAGRWRSFAYSEILERDECNLSIRWLREQDDPTDGVGLNEMAEDIMRDLQLAMSKVERLVATLRT
jgi:type I restriction enzyme M protein